MQRSAPRARHSVWRANGLLTPAACVVTRAQPVMVQQKSQLGTPTPETSILRTVLSACSIAIWPSSLNCRQRPVTRRIKKSGFANQNVMRTRAPFKLARAPSSPMCSAILPSFVPNTSSALLRNSMNSSTGCQLMAIAVAQRSRTLGLQSSSILSSAGCPNSDLIQVDALRIPWALICTGGYFHFDRRPGH